MARSPFIWGQSGQKMTPEQVARQRDVALALMGRGADFSPAKGGFYEALGRGLQGWASGRMNKLAREAEAEGMSAADERWQQLSGALGQSEAPAIAPQGFGISEPTYSFPQSLIESESGGNWGALNSEGYGGRLQFGASRLADAANAGVIPAGMTGAEFSRLSPEMQQSVERWHFADIDRTSQNMGLDRYIGQTVAGIPITQDGIRAMAHLGGIGGAAKFLSSGGAYNPSDSNGTRLSDYAARHGGSGGSYTQPSAQNVSALAEAMGDPWFAKQYGPVAEAMMGQQMQMQNAAYQQQLKQQDPAYVLGLEKAQLELDALRNPGPAAPIKVGDKLVDPVTMETLYDGSSDPDSFRTLQLRAEQAGLAPGTEAYQQFMAQGGGTSRDPEAERRIGALVSRGMPREEAENIVYGFSEVVSDPVLGSPMIVDRTTGTATPIDQGIGEGQTPTGPATPPPGGSLYELAEFSTGAVPGLQEKWTEVAPQFGLPGVDGITESRQVLNAASRDLVRALSINPRYPVGEMERIEKEINIRPSAFTSPQALQERMRAVDTVLRRRLENERRTAANPNLPVSSRRDALQAANDIENFLVTLGVPQGDDAAPQADTGLQPGVIEDGYRYKGGDPADPNNWEAVQ